MLWSAVYTTLVHSLLSPVATGGVGALVGLAPPEQSSKPPNWNMKHYKSVEFLSIFRMSSSPNKRKAPLLKLSNDGSESAVYSSFVHKKLNLAQMKQEFQYLRAQWHGQPKILGGSMCLILGEQQYFAWDTAS